MICYLAMSSIATTHALPVLGKNNDSNSISSVITNSYLNSDSEQDQSMNDIMPCHKGLSSTVGEVNAKVVCEIFCGAIAHAIISPKFIQASPKLNPTYYHTKTANLSPVKLNVEQQPPK